MDVNRSSVLAPWTYAGILSTNDSLVALAIAGALFTLLMTALIFNRKPRRSPAEEVDERLRRRRYPKPTPPPFPNGWIPVMDSSELAVGQVKRLDIFVIWLKPLLERLEWEGVKSANGYRSPKCTNAATGSVRNGRGVGCTAQPCLCSMNMVV
ncbi:uncharacterized protein LOC142775283 [Rhipicephalus microplus]|uniref:uncharacterized protein LOC142775283 n=1 Tax=Rhipicephalus microplus TaxID=6941 RepID=UPI003F6D612B